MSVDIVALRSYYGSPAGQLAERTLADALKRFAKPHRADRVLGFGYATPWLAGFGEGAERTLNFMPAAQGAYPWPVREKPRTALVFEEDLPLPDSAVDTVLMVHALEHAQSPRDTLAEFWRVLAPNGRLVIVVPSVARRLGALRAHTLRHRPALFHGADARAAARHQFLGRRHRAGAALPAFPAPRHTRPVGRGGKDRCAPLADVCGRAHHRGKEARFPRPARQGKTLAARLCPRSCPARRADAGGRWNDHGLMRDSEKTMLRLKALQITKMIAHSGACQSCKPHRGAVDCS
jgi:SAM-dependent methyltransferase